MGILSNLFRSSPEEHDPISKLWDAYKAGQISAAEMQDRQQRHIGYCPTHNQPIAARIGSQLVCVQCLQESK